MDGSIQIPASLLWSVIAGAGGVIGTLSMMLLKAKEKHAEDVLNLTKESMTALNNSTAAITALTDRIMSNV